MQTLFLLSLLVVAPALREGETLQTTANPIRKVVTMLQNMQKKVEAEGEKEQALFDKFMCYCKNSGGDLSKSINDAGVKIPQLEADIKEGEARKAQLDEDIKQHQVDRSAAKTAMADATALREKEAATYAAEANEAKANIAAVEKATAAIEKGMGSAFLQTPTASILRRLVQKSEDQDKQELVSFLSGAQSEDYAPASGEITGILKTMHDEMSASYADATATENAAIKAYGELMAAKTKEVNALTKALEDKMTRVGEVAVANVQMKNDLGDTEAALIEDKKFLADLEKNCQTKTAEWEEIVKTRSEELLALADTIKVLNDDDSLELFKKTLPGASASFVQMKVSTATVRSRAMAAIRSVKRSPQMDFIALAIHGKKIGFDKVIGMIDEMVATLKTEQQDDDHKKEYCAKQFDLSDDKKKSLERSVSDLETAIADAKDGIANANEEIKALQAGIKALDNSVAEATAQRKSENEDFQALMASDSAAKEILGFAKNRLNKFYNPSLYKPPPKRELSDEDRATLAAGGTLAPTAAPGGIAGTGVTVLASISEHGVAKPPPPPEAPGAYKKKSGESNGVIAMIDLLVKDLDKEMTEAKAEEKDAQGDYEQMMKDSAAKRADDSKALENKESAVADMTAALQRDTDAKASDQKELGATLQYINSLHNECDWLLQYFEVRKEARTSEIDALGKAKAVLSGADFSLVQLKSKKFLMHA